ncbi:hypothetical protein IE077_004504 [Cardiosporidium cionae]|uniref:Uncharacterized protein n=1 Tax=Cardiosporidium cionae TaxID=476202 RepID=A0ABQ7J8L4_9APIC|nr:hypothetical protein IE077_004504 [Cardiosporidium cionae]|eukprot:KAF8820343.1 hypothetical protein IE077_004504 [Cardiosporidium cionae]
MTMPEKHKSTLLQLAEISERCQDLTRAEEFYIKAEKWKNAVEMYQNLRLWSQAREIAKMYGSEEDFICAVLKEAKAESMYRFNCSGENCNDMKTGLLEQGLLEAAIQFEISRGNFDSALELSSNSPSVARDILCQRANSYKVEQRWNEAEMAFLEANEAEKAIQMYVENVS